jgi:hypothetical protein
VILPSAGHDVKRRLPASTINDFGGAPGIVPELSHRLEEMVFGFRLILGGATSAA